MASIKPKIDAIVLKGDYVTVTHETKSSDSLRAEKQGSDEKSITASTAGGAASSTRARLMLMQVKVKAVPASRGNLLGRVMTLRSYWTFGVSVNSVAAKYIQMMNNTTLLSWAGIVSNLAEFSSFATFYDELFVHSIVVEFYPVNKNSANYAGNGLLATAAGAPGFPNTCGATIGFIPHNAGTYSDSAIVWASMRCLAQSKGVDLADDWKFKATNPERFDWMGPLGDSSSATASMGWLNLASVSSKLGGSFQLSTPEPSGAAAGIGTLVEGGVFGHCIAKATVSLRSRT